MHLVDPKEVLLRAIADFESTGDMQTLHEAGLTRDDALQALSEWRNVLEGVGAAGDTEEEEGEDETLDTEEEEVAGGQDSELMRRRGSVTRTDFPLLAAICASFLPCRPRRNRLLRNIKVSASFCPTTCLDMITSSLMRARILPMPKFTWFAALWKPSVRQLQSQAIRIREWIWRSGFSSLETVRVSEERRFHITKNYRQTIELADWVRHLGTVLYGDPNLKSESAHEHGPSPKLVVEPAFGKIVRTAASSLRDWYADDRNPFAAALLIGFSDGMLTRFHKSVIR